MDYELAKQLKDAGFPCICSTFKVETHGSWICDHSSVPTLEELIEACGKAFHMLVNDIDEKQEWRAHSQGIPVEMARGSTPKEALARLWLALNKK